MTGRPPAVVVALRLEGLALRGHTGGVPIVRCGMGPRRVHKRAPRFADRQGWVSTGFCGGLAPGVRPGDVVVADTVVIGDRRLPVPAGPRLAQRLQATGLRVHLGPIYAADAVVHGAQRARLAAAGHLAVDLESGALGTLAGERPFAIVRAVADTADAPLLHPATPLRVWRALRSLRVVAPQLGAWAKAPEAARGAESEEVG
jgi:4-hydroxy-3-methylbut-2-enyl diphosphate reductase